MKNNEDNRCPHQFWDTKVVRFWLRKLIRTDVIKEIKKSWFHQTQSQDKLVFRTKVNSMLITQRIQSTPSSLAELLQNPNSLLNLRKLLILYPHMCISIMHYWSGQPRKVSKWHLLSYRRTSWPTKRKSIFFCENFWVGSKGKGRA